MNNFVSYNVGTNMTWKRIVSICSIPAIGAGENGKSIKSAMTNNEAVMRVLN